MEFHHFVKVRAQRIFVALSLILGVCAPSFALHQYIPTQHPHQAAKHISKRRSRLHRVLWNPVFRPSHESLLRQNEEIDRMDLPRIYDDAELQQLIAKGDLVPIEESDTLRIDRRLDPSRRYCRPWTRSFLDDISQAYYQQFHTSIQVNSAVRTVLGQKKLRRHNRNAAPEYGDTASSHLAGITVDIQRRGMTRQQIQWMEQYMMPLRDRGLLEPEEERHQWVFHVAVSGHYADWHEARMAAGKQLDSIQDLDQFEFQPQRVSDGLSPNQ
jgi:Family of unknown function (DUF5715)